MSNAADKGTADHGAAEVSPEGNGQAPAPNGRLAGNGHGPIHIGIALSGGASKAVAHVGVLKAFDEAGIIVDAVSATSGGTIVGALYAAGLGSARLESIALSLTWKTMAHVRLSRLGFLSSDRIEKFVASTIGDITFDELKIPFAVVATNLDAGSRHVFREGRVAAACRASCSIPQIYRPVEIDGRLYVDGGMVEDLPLLALREMGPPLAVGVNLAAGGTFGGRPRHFFHLAWHLGVIVSRQNAMSMEALGDVVVRPQLQPYSSMHFRNIDDMIAEGYRCGREAIPAIEASWAALHARPARRVGRRTPARRLAQRPLATPPQLPT